MKLLPFENYRLRTKLTPTEIISKLQDKIEPKKLIRFNWWGFGMTKKETKPYEGRIVNNFFQINRIIEGRNSFLPVITGELSRQNNETEIHIIMRMAIYTHVVLLYLFAILCFPFGFLIASMEKHKHFQPGVFLFVVLIVIFYTIMLGMFKYESSRSKKFLAELFAE